MNKIVIMMAMFLMTIGSSFAKGNSACTGGTKEVSCKGVAKAKRANFCWKGTASAKKKEQICKTVKTAKVKKSTAKKQAVAKKKPIKKKAAAKKPAKKAAVKKPVAKKIVAPPAPAPVKESMDDDMDMKDDINDSDDGSDEDLPVE